MKEEEERQENIRASERRMEKLSHIKEYGIDYKGGNYKGEWYLPDNDYKEGYPSGYGTFTDSAGRKWKGEWQQGKIHSGSGTYLYDNHIFTGSWYSGISKDCTVLTPNKSTYKGRVRNFIYEGYGCMIYSDGDKYEGEWDRDKWNGEGTFTPKDGPIQKGAWEDGKFVRGKVIYSSGNVYEGKYENGDRNGEGTLTFSDGNKWTGIWKDGNPFTGKGVYTFNEGLYNGSVVEGKYQGHGTLIYKNGESWKGEWKNGNKCSGEGVHNSIQGKYEGKLLNGKYNGKGNLIYSKGGKWEGEWKNGNNYTGTGVYYHENEKYTGEMVNGHYHGEGTIEYKDNTKWKGRWSSSKPWTGEGTYKTSDRTYIGIWEGGICEKYIATFNNKDEYSGRVKDLLFEGQGSILYANRNSYTGAWEKGKCDGSGVWLAPDGSIKKGTWKDGLFISGTINYSDGRVYIGNLQNDQLHGEGVMKYENEEKCEGEFKDGKPYTASGVWIENGIRKEGQWKDGGRYGKNIHIYQDGARLEYEMTDGVMTSFIGIHRHNGYEYNGKLYIDGSGNKIFSGIIKKDGMESRGEFINYKPLNAVGTYVASNGEKFTGQWIGGTCQHCIVNFTNGDVYRGGIENLKRQGPGMIQYYRENANPRIWNGVWNNDLPFNGRGKYMGKPGARRNAATPAQKGRWKQGSFHRERFFNTRERVSSCMIM